MMEPDQVVGAIYPHRGLRAPGEIIDALSSAEAAEYMDSLVARYFTLKKENLKETLHDLARQREEMAMGITRKELEDIVLDALIG